MERPRRVPMARVAVKRTRIAVTVLPAMKASAPSTEIRAPLIVRRVTSVLAAPRVRVVMAALQIVGRILQRVAVSQASHRVARSTERRREARVSSGSAGHRLKDGAALLFVTLETRVEGAVFFVVRGAQKVETHVLAGGCRVLRVVRPNAGAGVGEADFTDASG